LPGKSTGNVRIPGGLQRADRAPQPETSRPADDDDDDDDDGGGGLRGTTDAKQTPV